MKQEADSAADFLPDKLSISALKTAAAHCRGCPLYKNATQTVFGEGPARAHTIVVGEIPGQKEDEMGKPFVGPAGTLMRKTIESVGLDARNIYFTNVVKHFKFVYMNKRKLHRTPTRKEVKACKPWIDAEIKVIKPKVIVCLGSTAAQALISNTIRITQSRGKWIDVDGVAFLVTYHPSAILRAPDEKNRHLMKRLFAEDMQKVAMYLSKIKELA